MFVGLEKMIFIFKKLGKQIMEQAKDTNKHEVV